MSSRLRLGLRRGVRRDGRSPDLGHLNARGGPCPGSDVLVAGWFSWPDCGMTAGDVLAAEVVCRWLEEAGRVYDVARAAPLTDGVDFRSVEPSRYRDVVFVCGPIHSETPIDELLSRFPHSRHVAIGVSMIAPVAAWNPFDVLLERDSERAVRPDLAFCADSARNPLVGVVLVEPYTPEYPGRDMQEQARAAVERLRAVRTEAFLPIDTRLAPGGLEHTQIQALISRMDAVLTTRLHGLVLAIKHGVPALAVDPVSGGAKILAQAQELGWPAAVSADQATQTRMTELFEFCLSESGRDAARISAARAADRLQDLRRDFVEQLR